MPFNCFSSDQHGRLIGFYTYSGKKWVWRFQQQLERAAVRAQPALEPKSKFSVEHSLKIFGLDTLTDLCQEWVNSTRLSDGSLLHPRMQCKLPQFWRSGLTLCSAGQKNKWPPWGREGSITRDTCLLLIQRKPLTVSICLIYFMGNITFPIK